jgi:hypothetical protein
MNKKYKKRKNSTIDQDYWHYLGQEGIYGVVFGHRKGMRKAIYIWRVLLREYHKE